jgi:2-polyprenyl-3-methyl-5-hydroxy-6-metoxy-1,4-benzoquinol methylase
MLQELRRVLHLSSHVKPVAGAEQGREFYDKRYQHKAHKRLPFHLSHYYALWTVIADRVRGVDGVLEVGCGGGQLAALMLRQGLRHYTGFDLSPAAIEIARQQCPDANFIEADAFETDLFSTARYDTIVCTEVLEHIDADRELIGRWRPGVRCVCSVPDCPAKAHVRHFDSEEQVLDRYAALFDDLTVTTHTRATERPARFFLMDGRLR